MPARIAVARQSARRWTIGVAAAAALGLALVAAQAVFGEVRPGNRLGMAWGIAAAAVALFGAAYGARRRAPRLASRLRAGRSESWLRLHLAAGGLFLVLVEAHVGFGLPDGWITWSLWLASLATVLGGAAGLALQRWIPKQLASGLAHEVHFERIPELVDELRRRAEAIGSSGDEALRRLWEDEVSAEMAQPRRRAIFFLDITGGIRSRLRPFEHLERFLGAEGREALGRLEGLYRTKLEIDAHYTLQSALRGWLVVHTPLAVLLVALLLLHVFTVLYY